MRRIFQNSSHKQMLSETLPTLSRRTMLLGGVFIDAGLFRSTCFRGNSSAL